MCIECKSMGWARYDGFFGHNKGVGCELPGVLELMFSGTQLPVDAIFMCYVRRRCCIVSVNHA